MTLAKADIPFLVPLCFLNSKNNKQTYLCLVAQAFNPSSGEAEAERSL